MELHNRSLRADPARTSWVRLQVLVLSEGTHLSLNLCLFELCLMPLEQVSFLAWTG